MRSRLPSAGKERHTFDTGCCICRECTENRLNRRARIDSARPSLGRPAEARDIEVPAAEDIEAQAAEGIGPEELAAEGTDLAARAAADTDLEDTDLEGTGPEDSPADIDLGVLAAEPGRADLREGCPFFCTR